MPLTPCSFINDHERFIVGPGQNGTATTVAEQHGPLPVHSEKPDDQTEAL
jgi:hypothetical protein